MISKHRPCFYTRHKWRTLWPRSFFMVTSWCEQLWTDEVAWGLSSVQVSFLQIHLCFLRNNLNCPLTAEETLQMSHLWHLPFNEPLNIISTVLPTVRVSPTFQEQSKKKVSGLIMRHLSFLSRIPRQESGKIDRRLSVCIDKKNITHQSMYSGEHRACRSLIHH